MRQPRRQAAELSDTDRWDCVWGCGKSCRATSTRSIQRHANCCSWRADGRDDEVDVKGLTHLHKLRQKGIKRRLLQLRTAEEEDDALSEQHCSLHDYAGYRGSALFAHSTADDSSDAYSAHSHSPQSSDLTASPHHPTCTLPAAAASTAEWTMWPPLSSSSSSQPAADEREEDACFDDGSSTSIAASATTTATHLLATQRSAVSERWHTAKQEPCQPSTFGWQLPPPPQPPPLPGQLRLHQQPPSAVSAAFLVSPPPLLLSPPPPACLATDSIRAYTDMLSRYLLSA